MERTLGNVRDEILTSFGGRASEQVQGDLICDCRAEMNVEQLADIKNTIILFVCLSKILHKHCFQFLLGPL